MKRTWMVLGLLVFALSASTISTFLPHRLYGKRIAGQVVDADTGKPIGGAHVAFFWQSPIIPSGFTGHNSRDICYHAAATVTDTQGRFAVPPWRKWSTFSVFVLDPTAIVYARGYTPRQIPLLEGDFKPPEEKPNERYALRRFSGTVDERLEVMWAGIANHGCMYGGESQKSLFPMLKAMYDEAKGIGTTPEQEKDVYFFSVMAAQAAVARDPNTDANDAEINSFIKEKLQ